MCVSYPPFSGGGEDNQLPSEKWNPVHSASLFSAQDYIGVCTHDLCVSDGMLNATVFVHK